MDGRLPVLLDCLDRLHVVQGLLDDLLIDIEEGNEQPHRCFEDSTEAMASLDRRLLRSGWHLSFDR